MMSLSLMASCTVFGCGAYQQRPISVIESGAWSLSVLKTDYNFSIRHADVIYQPEDDYQFVLVIAMLTNNTQQTRKFRWSHCQLDHAQGTFLPMSVTATNFWQTPKASLELIPPGKTVERRLILSYPEDDLPPHISCKDMRVPLLFD